MPVFKKQILPEGRYLVMGKDQERRLASFDKAKLNTISNNTKQMIQAGLKIPAPFQHLKEAVPVTDIPIDNSYDNAGYWRDVWVEEDAQGKSSLWAEIDAPGDVTDFASPAGKIQNTIKEVSACISDQWQDGLGRSWGPCMTHGALVVHPVVPGQTDFSMVADSVVLSMSGIVADINPGDMASLSQALADSVKVFLPPETLLQDLPKVLLVALKQFKLCLQDDDSDTEVVQAQPIFMSLTEPNEMPITKKEALHLLSMGALSAKTQKPLTLEDFEIEADPRDALNLSLVTHIADSQKESLKRRAEALVTDGRMTKDFAEQRVYPQIAAINLSLVQFDDANKLQPFSVETVIESIEALPVPSGKGKVTPDPVNLALGDVVVVPSADNDNGQAMTADQQNAMIKEMLASM